MDKIKLKSYSEKYNGIKKRKIFLIICIIILLSVIIGILYLAMLNKEGKEIVVNTVNTYFKDLNSSKAINNNLVNVLKNNIILTGIMWFLGVSLVGVIFEVLFLILKGFSLGFSISSFIYVFKFQSYPVKASPGTGNCGGSSDFMESRAKCGVCCLWTSWHIKPCSLYTYRSDTRAYGRGT